MLYLVGMQNINSSQTNSSRSGNIIVGLLIGIVLALIPSYYYYNQYQETQKLLKNPQLLAKDQTKSILDKLGKLYDLPKDETPTIATVQDKNKLKDQAFFAKAANGDKLVIYLKAKKAILYRESTDKIIEVAPVNIDKKAAGATTPAPSEAMVKPSGAVVQTTVTPAVKAVTPSPVTR